MGSKVNVVLKQEDDTITGVLFDIEDDCIYLQIDVNTTITVPKENIKYYVSVSLTEKQSYNGNLMVTPQNDQLSQSQQTTNIKESKPVLTSIKVLVNQAFITEIPVPPTFDLSVFHDDIMKVVLGNGDVQAVISGRVQESLEYLPGEVRISVRDNESIQADMTQQQDPFSMSGLGTHATNNFLNPSQMVSRLNKVSQLKPKETK